MCISVMNNNHLCYLFQIKHTLRKEEIQQEFVSMLDMLIEMKNKVMQSLDEVFYVSL